jgi:hypothetical protein
VNVGVSRIVSGFFDEAVPSGSLGFSRLSSGACLRVPVWFRCQSVDGSTELLHERRQFHRRFIRPLIASGLIFVDVLSIMRVLAKEEHLF